MNENESPTILSPVDEVFEEFFNLLSKRREVHPDTIKNLRELKSRKSLSVPDLLKLVEENKRDDEA
jgi:hypothetical protein